MTNKALASKPDDDLDDIPELTEEDFKRGSRLKDMKPELHKRLTEEPIETVSVDDGKRTVVGVKRKRGERGSQKTPTKISTTLRLSPEVIEHFKSQGKGWQSRINEALKQHIADTK